ncbi:MAG: hypothetical protein RLZZ241_1684 [Bacteroidota bacterium]|jgi:cytoskeletal protein CcmA (bactofilin family)
MINSGNSIKEASATSGHYSSVESTSLITGGINSDSDLRIDGIVDGNVKTIGKIIIGKNGHLLGNATCKSAEISGHFNGELKVADMLVLRETAIVEGSVFLGKLAVTPGAVFNARCSMHKHDLSKKPNN